MYFTFSLESDEDPENARFVDWPEVEADRLAAHIESGKYAWLRNFEPYRDWRIAALDVRAWRSELEGIREHHRSSVIETKRRGPKGSKTTPRAVLEAQSDKLFAQDPFDRHLGETIELFKVAETNGKRILFSGM